MAQQSSSATELPTPVDPCSILATDSLGVMYWQPICEYDTLAALCAGIGCGSGIGSGSGIGVGSGVGTGIYGYGYCINGGTEPGANNVLEGEINIDEILGSGQYSIDGILTTAGVVDGDISATIVFYQKVGDYSEFAIVAGTFDGFTISCGYIRILTGDNTTLSPQTNYLIRPTDGHVNYS